MINETDFSLLINWLGYTLEEYLEPKRHLFHFRRKKLIRYIDVSGIQVSIDFEDWNVVMNLVDSIESKGYAVIISTYEIKIVRDYINNPYLAPNADVLFQIDRKDKTRKYSILQSCIRFISKYNSIINIANNQVRDNQYV